jgi:hypothetical protein
MARGSGPSGGEGLGCVPGGGRTRGAQRRPLQCLDAPPFFFVEAPPVVLSVRRSRPSGGRFRASLRAVTRASRLRVLRRNSGTLIASRAQRRTIAQTEAFVNDLVEQNVSRRSRNAASNLGGQPEGRGGAFCRPCRDWRMFSPVNPRLKPWAMSFRPSGTWERALGLGEMARRGRGELLVVCRGVV